MRQVFATVLIAATAAACSAQPFTVAPAPGNVATLGAVAEKALAPLVLSRGLKLTYAVKSQAGGQTYRATFQQEIVALTPTTAVIRHTQPDPNGRPFSFLETVSLQKALVSARWTSQAVVSPAIDPEQGAVAIIKVKAGTFRTHKVKIAGPGPTVETWYFSGLVPVKVEFQGLNQGKINVSAELVSF